MTLKQTLLDTIGHTPLIKLNHMNPFSLVTILLKLERNNPSGSSKDRIMVPLLNDAERKGLIKPGGVLIESTTGNGGASLAMIANIRGYQTLLTLPDSVPTEKQTLLKALGAKLILCPGNASFESSEHYVNQAKELSAKTPNSFRINQLDNLKNPEAHYLTTGPEIWEQTEGEIDYLISTAKTGGTLSGAGRYLKEKKNKLKILMPDPPGSVYTPYFKTGRLPDKSPITSLIIDAGNDHIPKVLDFSLIDEVIPFTDQEAFSTCHTLAKKEGLLVNGATGAALFVALKLAETLSRPATLVVITS